MPRSWRECSAETRRRAGEWTGPVRRRGAEAAQAQVRERLVELGCAGDLAGYLLDGYVRRRLPILVLAGNLAVGNVRIQRLLDDAGTVRRRPGERRSGGAGGLRRALRVRSREERGCQATRAPPGPAVTGAELPGPASGAEAPTEAVVAPRLRRRGRACAGASGQAQRVEVPGGPASCLRGRRRGAPRRRRPPPGLRRPPPGLRPRGARPARGRLARALDPAARRWRRRLTLGNLIAGDAEVADDGRAGGDEVARGLLRGPPGASGVGQEAERGEPERDRNKMRERRELWWRFIYPGLALHEAVGRGRAACGGSRSPW